MQTRYVDTETCGRHGVPVLIQYAIGDGPVVLHDIWTNPARKTITLIEEICQDAFVGFNIAFDWFHLYKIYTMLRHLGGSDFPEDHIDRLAEIEERARFDDICIRPAAALDLMLVARRGKFQSLMPRDPVRIRRVPSALAHRLADELDARLKLDPIYFEKAKDKQVRWKVYDKHNADGSYNPDFKDVVLRFRASGALKSLAKHCLNLDTSKLLLYRDIEIDKQYYPQEIGYAPFALAVTPDGWPWARRGKWGQRKKALIRSWPAMIRHHIQHWGYNERARTYGTDDVVYTRRLHKEVFTDVEPGDRDSELACMVACVRWSGYAIDTDRLKTLAKEADEKIGAVPRDPKKVKQYLLEGISNPTDCLVYQKGTKKVVLETLATNPDWAFDDCPDCKGVVGLPCDRCEGTGAVKSQIGVRAKAVLEARQQVYRKEVIRKLLIAMRFHADFNVGGTLSNRMAGTGGINSQGLDHTTEFRSCFLFSDLDSDFTTCGGDFKSFEVALACTVFDDDNLTTDLKTGKKIHAIMGAELSGLTYDEVRATEGSKVKDWYDTGKKGVFLLFYGGDENTFETKLGVPLETGLKAKNRIHGRYRGIKRFGDEIEKDFAALSQPGGIGSKVYWTDPKDYVESFLGFRRSFELENKIRKILFDLGQDMPKEWKTLPVKVKRSDRLQTAGGATSSALYGACFGLSGAIVRQAKNHKIQSPGAEITKETQLAVWSHQPRGISRWIVKPMNVHDEINTPVRKGYEQAVQQSVMDVIEKHKARIPLLAIDWKIGIVNWAQKKG